MDYKTIKKETKNEMSTNCKRKAYKITCKMQGTKDKIQLSN